MGVLKGHQLPICLPSSCPTAPGSHRRLPQLGHSFLFLVMGVGGVLEPLRGLRGAACYHICPVHQQGVHVGGLKRHRGNATYKLSIPSLTGPPLFTGTTQDCWPLPLLLAALGPRPELGAPQQMGEISALVAQLVIGPPHAQVPVPQSRSHCPGPLPARWRFTNN